LRKKKHTSFSLSSRKKATDFSDILYAQITVVDDVL